MSKIKHIYKSFDEPGKMTTWLDSISHLNQTIEGVWGTPLGVHVLLVFWDEESVKELDKIDVSN